MKRFGLIALGLLLLLPLGCGKTEEKSPADGKTPGGTASNTPEKTTPEQPANAKTSAQLASNTPKTPTPKTDPVPKTPPKTTAQAPGPGASSLPGEYAALGHIPQNAVFLVSARASAILNNELIKGLPEKGIPIDKELASLQEQSGVDPRTIERVTFALWPGDGHVIPGPSGENFPAPTGSEPPKFDGVVVVQLSQAVDSKTLEAKMSSEKKHVSHNGIEYLVNPPQQTAYYMPSPKLLVMSHTDDMAEVLDNKTPAKVVESAVKSGLDHDLAVVALLESFREQLQGPALMADQTVKGVADLPRQLEAAKLYVDLKDGVDLQIVIDANTEEAPKTIKKAYDLGYAAAGAFLGGALPGMAKQQLGEEAAKDVVQLATQLFQSAKGEAAGEQFKLSLHVPRSAAEVIQSVVAVQQQRMQEVVKSLEATNDLKQIGIAAFNYHDIHGVFPYPAGRSDAPQAEKGKLSWRVHLLPSLGEQELYEKFKLDEAWDSEHNKKLLEQMPDVYKLGDKAKAGHTQFVAPAGKGFVVDGERTRKVQDFTDGTSNTIMVLTVTPEKAQPWTKPGGFDLDPAKAGEVLGGVAQGFLGLMADGSVHTFHSQLDADTLKALLTIAGGEPVNPSNLGQ